jgi:hypothetical protein
MGDQKFIISTYRRFGEHIKPLVPTAFAVNPHWARVVVYGPFSLGVIHKKGLCPNSGNINSLMILRVKRIFVKYYAIIMCNVILDYL